MFDNTHPQTQLLLVAYVAQPYSLSRLQPFSLIFAPSIVTKEGLRTGRCDNRQIALI